MNKKDLKLTLHQEFPVVKTTALQYFGSKFRYMLPFFPFFIRQIKIPNDTRLIISSSHSVAKGVSVVPSQLHISYFQARNMKYIWEESHLYFKGVKRFLKIILPLLRIYDKKSAQLPTHIISNSKFVQGWVEKNYGRRSELIYPPVNVSSFSLGDHKGKFFVTVGRLEPYKRFDLIIEAFNINGMPLKVIGDGSQSLHLKNIANENIEFLGFQSADRINQELGCAKAFVYIGIEDFGIAPVEAQATGAPVICLNKAGTAETVLNGTTGVLFEEQTVISLNKAMDRFYEIQNTFNYQDIREHAFKFSEKRFQKEFKAFLDEKLLSWEGNVG